MIRPEMFRQHFTMLIPKIRELWPNVTEDEVKATNGDLELLVTKVREKYKVERDEILNKLAPFLPAATGKTEPAVVGKNTKGS